MSNNYSYLLKLVLKVQRLYSDRNWRPFGVLSYAQIQDTHKKCIPKQKKANTTYYKMKIFY